MDRQRNASIAAKAAGALGAALVVGVLAGCVSQATLPILRQRATASPAAPGPSHDAAASRTVAEGAFVSADGDTTGTVRVTLVGDDVVLDASTLTSTAPGDLELTLSPYAATDPCPADTDNQVLGLVRGKDLRSIAIGSTRTDPSFYRTVLLARASGDGGNTPCRLTPVAAATLTWTMPDTHPGLTVVASAPTDGANGSVVMQGGTPEEYVVAEGDNMFSIARRLGITDDDLAYLNPLAPTPLQPGQRLNLDKRHRGAPVAAPGPGPAQG